MTTQARAEYFESERLGIITTKGGKELRIANVTLSQFQKLVARHDAKVARSGDAAANFFTR